MLITARPSFAPPSAASRHLTRLALNRLGQRQCAAMVRELAGGKPRCREAVLAEIVAKTDGIPLFVEELTKTVLESGLLEETADGYRLRGPLPALAIPATLQDSLMARLDRWRREGGGAGRRVIGREFAHGLLEAVAGWPGERLDAALAGLEEAGADLPRGAAQDRQYVFKHALVRDAAYETLLHERRQDIHKRILAALERSPETPPRFSPSTQPRRGSCSRPSNVGRKRARSRSRARPTRRRSRT